MMEMAQVDARVTGAEVAAAVDQEETGSSGTTRKRKAGSGDGEMELSSSTLIQLKSPRRVVVKSGNTTSPAKSVNSGSRRALKDYCSSSSSDLAPESCCSSNGSSELAAMESCKCVDLRESVEIASPKYNYKRRDRKERTPLTELQSETGELESSARPSDPNSHRRSTVEKMPSQAELEEFFAVAEKNLQKRFTDKYNYDIVKDVPLEGRYEWIRLKP